MTPKQIPESRIAINPVIINDSKRGEPTRCPLDELYAEAERRKREKAGKKYTGTEFLEDVVR